MEVASKMTQRIFKYKLETDVFPSKVTELPEGQILDYGMQEGVFYTWILIDDEKLDLTERHHYRVIGTGWDVGDLKDYTFCKTIHDPYGLVWHLFRRIQ